MISSEVKKQVANGLLDDKITYLYVCGPEKVPAYRERFIHAIEEFEDLFGEGREISIFSAPGRTEVCGNHTDHQHGHVLAASVNLDVIAIVSQTGDNRVCIKSEGYPMDTVNISDHTVYPEEANTSLSLIRGICAKFSEIGYRVGGFDAYTTSNVLGGSGLSSSAAFEVLVGTIVNDLFCGGRETALKIAQIGQYAENVYFGKPCGLMDQAASSVGNFIAIDFKDRQFPQVEQVSFDFSSCGYALCIIDSRSSHADLTPDYAAIPEEMKAVAQFFGKDVLSEVDEADFYAHIPQIREAAGDRSVLRAIHFYGDDARVLDEVKALKEKNFDEFKRLVIESGASSYQYLQNVFSPTHVQQQGVSLTLALCQKLLEPVGGAWRVHGGGFAGTVQTFVPAAFLSEFISHMEAVLGKGSCHSLAIRPTGGYRFL